MPSETSLPLEHQLSLLLGDRTIYDIKANFRGNLGTAFEIVYVKQGAGTKIDSRWEQFVAQLTQALPDKDRQNLTRSGDEFSQRLSFRTAHNPIEHLFTQTEAGLRKEESQDPKRGLRRYAQRLIYKYGLDQQNPDSNLSKIQRMFVDPKEGKEIKEAIEDIYLCAIDSRRETQELKKALETMARAIPFLIDLKQYQTPENISLIEDIEGFVMHAHRYLHSPKSEAALKR